MGIKGLMKLISDNAPGNSLLSFGYLDLLRLIIDASKERDISHYFGRIVAIDVSMSLYQLLIAVRSGPEGQQLTNDNGDVTSHLQGMFYRTLRMLDNGIKPVFVFDGAAPTLKNGELAKRRARLSEANTQLEEAKQSENVEDIKKYEKRTVRVTKEHNDDVKHLLRLMGVPVIEASGEAEAQCAVLAKAGLVYATATEDMDSLTFGSPRLLRHMTFSAARKMPIVEIDLKMVLTKLKMSQEEFIQLCILCGCDYSETIKGIGPVSALKLINEHRSIASSIPHLGKKFRVPEGFMYAEAADIFKNPVAIPAAELKSQLVWKKPDIHGIIQFLVTEKGFNLERVKAGLKRLDKAKGKSDQQRIDSMFTSVKSENVPKPKKVKDEKKKSTLSEKAKQKFSTKPKSKAKDKPKATTKSKSKAKAKPNNSNAKKVKKLEGKIEKKSTNKPYQKEEEEIDDDDDDYDDNQGKTKLQLAKNKLRDNKSKRKVIVNEDYEYEDLMFGKRRKIDENDATIAAPPEPLPPTYSDASEFEKIVF